MRNRFHSICPYFAMFPETFVRKNLVWAKNSTVVLDPFSGRGTTVFESLLAGRLAIGGDRNPVAYCLSAAKARPPTFESVRGRIRELRNKFVDTRKAPSRNESDFFRLCFSPSTLEQLRFLRRELNWRGSGVDRMIAALALGALHGESHRSPKYLSNRMPRTISTKPDYSVRWWRERKLLPPERDAFQVISSIADFRYASPLPETKGLVVHSDVRELGSRLAKFEERVGLVVTSPPYLDVTSYHEDQWLRLWFLGGPERPEPSIEGSDDRHRTVAGYEAFLEDSWRGIQNLLAPKAMFVIRIGMRDRTTKEVGDVVAASVAQGTGRRVKLLETVRSEIHNGQVHAFRPGLRDKRYEFDVRLQLR